MKSRVAISFGLMLSLIATSWISPKSAHAICGFEQGLNQMTIKASGHNLYMLWESRIGGFNSNANNYTLFFKKSIDDGMTFGPTINLYSTSEQPCYTLFSTMDIEKNSKSVDNVYVAWIGDGGIQFRASGDSGDSFGKTVSIGWGSFGTVMGPALIDWGGQMVADPNNGVYITSVSPGNPNEAKYVLFTRSTDGGKTFDAAKTFGNSSNHHQTPQVAVSGSNVYLVWSEYSDCVGYEADNCHVKIIFAKSTDRGKTFESAVSLTSGRRINNSTTANQNSSNCFGDFFCGIPSYPSIRAVGPDVFVSWLNNETETYFTRSTDNGTNFSTPVRLSTTTHLVDSNVEFNSPFMSANEDGRVQVGWIVDNGTAAAYNQPDYLVLATSNDWGSHFHQVSYPMPTFWGDSSYELLPHFDLSKDGTVYSVWPDALNEHIIFSVMHENQTNGKSTVLASNSTQYPQWHPRIAASNTGNLFVIWQNASSILPAGVLQPPLVLASSSDGGITFSRGTVVQEALVIPEFGSFFVPAMTIALFGIVICRLVGTRLRRG